MNDTSPSISLFSSAGRLHNFETIRNGDEEQATIIGRLDFRETVTIHPTSRHRPRTIQLTAATVGVVPLLPVAFLALLVVGSAAPPPFPPLFINAFVTGVTAFVISSCGAGVGEEAESSFFASTVDEGVAFVDGGGTPLPFLATTAVALGSGGITEEGGEKFNFFSAGPAAVVVVAECTEGVSELVISPPSPW